MRTTDDIYQELAEKYITLDEVESMTDEELEDVWNCDDRAGFIADLNNDINNLLDELGDEDDDDDDEYREHIGLCLSQGLPANCIW